jgi:hypothetical protein
VYVALLPKEINMASKVILSRTDVNNVQDLVDLLEGFTGKAEINIEQTVEYIETTLSDGSKIYDIHIV